MDFSFCRKMNRKKLLPKKNQGLFPNNDKKAEKELVFHLIFHINIGNVFFSCKICENDFISDLTTLSWKIY